MNTKKPQSDINEFGIKILDGVNRAVQKLIETAAINNESLDVGDDKGGSKSVPAKELLKQLAK